MSKIKKAIAILLIVLFLVTVTAGSVSATFGLFGCGRTKLTAENTVSSDGYVLPQSPQINEHATIMNEKKTQVSTEYREPIWETK